MKYTPREYAELICKHPHLKPNDYSPRRALPNTEPQCDQTPALDSTDAREVQSISRITICFTGFRVRPLDPDNFAGSVKDLLDGLRRAELIIGDEWQRINLETKQVKVSHRKDERTEITIVYP